MSGIAVGPQVQEVEADDEPRLIDAFGRAITYVRISVTDRCNLRCRYCMPSTAPEWMERGSLLSYDEIERFVRVAAAAGIRKIRLTGGEPMVRPRIPDLVARLTTIPGIRTVALSTNASLLAREAQTLKQAGLTALNISLDSLRADRFEHITKTDLFEQVWEGIEAAVVVGFPSLKLNVVVIRGFNDDEVSDFARLTQRMPVHVRFIEYMPIGADTAGWSRDKVVPVAEIRDRIAQEVGLEPVSSPPPLRRPTNSELRTQNSELLPSDSGVPARSLDADAGPERLWRVKGGGPIGFISPVSDEFCALCNRVRLTSDGMLRGCLMRDGEIDFRGPLRRGASDDEIRDLLHLAMARKPEKHLINSPDFQPSSFYTMNRLGG